MRCRGTERNSGLSSRGRSTHSVRRRLKRKGRRRIARPNRGAAPSLVESSPQALPKFQSLAADSTVVSHSQSRFSLKHCKLRGDDAPQSQKNALGSMRECLSHHIGQKWLDNYPIFIFLGAYKRRIACPPNSPILDPVAAGRSKCLRIMRHNSPPTQKSLTRGTKGWRTGVH